LSGVAVQKWLLLALESCENWNNFEFYGESGTLKTVFTDSK
jgi:hypothetical protein